MSRRRRRRQNRENPSVETLIRQQQADAAKDHHLTRQRDLITKTSRHLGHQPPKRTPGGGR